MPLYVECQNNLAEERGYDFCICDPYQDMIALGVDEIAAAEYASRNEDNTWYGHFLPTRIAQDLMLAYAHSMEKTWTSENVFQESQPRIMPCPISELDSELVNTII